MDLRKLLSVTMATLAALGTLMSALGQRSPWTALLLWTAAIVSVVVTDLVGWFRLGRNAAAVAALAILVIFLRSCFRYGGEARILALADLLVYLQIVLLFQRKDERVYWWLAVMSLLQVIVAAGFSQGFSFGVLLVIYMLVGLFGMTLMVLYSQRNRHGRGGRAKTTPLSERRPHPLPLSQRERGVRWPLGMGSLEFTSRPAPSSHAGVVRELFARLGVMGAGTLVLTGVIFFTVPRLGQPAWRGALLTPQSLVGFSDKITLGELGEILENRDEVMRVRLSDSSGRPYPGPGELYLRGAVVTQYQKGEWSRAPDSARSKRMFAGAARVLIRSRPAPAGRKGTALPGSPPPAVRQKIAVEPLDRDDLFSIWPIVQPVLDNRVVFDPETERLVRSEDLSGQRFSFELETTGLAGGVQQPLVPCQQPVDTAALLRMPELPRLAALANRWLAERPAAERRGASAARWLEQKFSQGDRFQYTLQGQDRDLSIDPIEDFVSNHPRGHCEYFATALALMLRSRGIPSRLVLGFRTDEWNDVGKFYQVRQLHAHAWVEAYVPPGELPAGLREGEDRGRWLFGGWLRLDPTPAADIGTAAADRSAWGQWQRRLHGMQSAWDDYVMEMDRQRQRDAVFRPLLRAMRTAVRQLTDPQWWRDLAARIAATLRLAAWPSLGGWLLGVVLPLTLGLLLFAAGVWGLARLLGRAWRWLAARAALRGRRAQSRVEFYRRFENLMARQGLVRTAGQTPREFAQTAGTRLAGRTGRGELAAMPLAVADALYRVRFGGYPLDKCQTQAVEHALAELAGASER